MSADVIQFPQPRPRPSRSRRKGFLVHFTAAQMRVIARELSLASPEVPDAAEAHGVS